MNVVDAVPGHPDRVGRDEVVLVPVRAQDAVIDLPERGENQHGRRVALFAQGADQAHAGWEAHEAPDDLDGGAVGQMGHLLVGEDAGDHALDAVPVAELVAGLDRLRIVQPPGAGGADRGAVLEVPRTPIDEGSQEVAAAPELRRLRLVSIV